jgi:hypothetical protein
VGKNPYNVKSYSYIDQLESHTGLKAHRGMIARRALELFLETHEAS